MNTAEFLKIISNSMTKQEIENPLLLLQSGLRIKRVARGAGVDVMDIRYHLKQADYSVSDRKKTLKKTVSSVNNGETDAALSAEI